MKEAGNRPVTKYWTFEDWKQAGEIDPLPRCRIGIEKKDVDSGERVLFLMTPEEITKLETNLEVMYWNEVMQEFGMLKSYFQRGWSDTADPMQITREIEKAQFHLYPEKFVDKPEPYSVSILCLDFKEDIPHYREAYANILSYGRPTWMTPLERDDDNYSCRADGMKLYLDWLKSFQAYFETHELTSKALDHFMEKEAIQGDAEELEEPNFYENHVRKYLSELEEYFTRTGEYEKAVGCLVSFFKNEPLKIDKPVLISGNNKCKLQLNLGNIYSKCVSGKYSDEYLETLSRVFEVLHVDNFDPTSSHAQNLRKRLSGY